MNCSRTPRQMAEEMIADAEQLVLMQRRETVALIQSGNATEDDRALLDALTAALQLMYAARSSYLKQHPPTAPDGTMLH